MENYIYIYLPIYVKKSLKQKILFGNDFSKNLMHHTFITKPTLLICPDFYITDFSSANLSSKKFLLLHSNRQKGLCFIRNMHVFNKTIRLKELQDIAIWKDITNFNQSIYNKISTSVSPSNCKDFPHSCSSLLVASFIVE